MDSDEGISSFRLRKQHLEPVATKRSTIGTEGREAKMVDIEVTAEEEPLSPAARMFQAPRFNCCVIAILGFKTKLNPDVIKDGLKHTLLKHPRFSSLLVVKKSQNMRWLRTEVDLEKHVIVPDLEPNMDSPDWIVEDYISDLTKIPMDMSKPLWELHILNIKTAEAESVGVLRIHHSIGDGTSLISLLLACTRKTSDPTALPTVPMKQRAGSRKYYSGFWWFLVTIWSLLQLLWNTFVDLLLFSATVAFLKDTETPLKGAHGVGDTPKRFVHRTVSLDDITLVKYAMNTTINDVVLGVTQAGLSRYLNRRYGMAKKDDGAMEKRNNLPKSIRLRAALLVNVRPSAGIEPLADMMEKESKTKWGNSIGYVLLPITIALQDDPLDYIREAKATMDRKKLSLEAICTFSSAEIMLKSFGAEAGAAVSHKVFSNTTTSVSNVVGPVEEISFYGHPIAYLAPSVYGHPHALAIHFQSYVNKMTIVLAVDQDVIPDPHQLCDDLEESLKLIKDAVLERGLIKDAA